MEENPVKVAVIGAGYWGKNLARVFFELGALDVICDSNTDTLEKMRLSYPGIRLIEQFSELLKDSSITAIAIATPAESHYSVAKEFLLAGKDVFVEKPLAVNVIEGEGLVQLAIKQNKILMVGHLLEYHPAVSKLKQLVDKGELGKINYIYSNRLNLGKIRKEENILWSFAPHDISVILSLLGELPESVSAQGGNYLHKDIADVTISSLSFKSGVRGHIFVSWLHPYKEQKLVVVGDKKMAVFDDVAGKDKLLLFSHEIDWIDRLPVSRKKDAEKIEFEMEEPLQLECRHFLDCVNKRVSPKTDGKSALKVLRVLQACQVSLEKGGISVTLLSLPNSSAPEKFYAHPTCIIEQPCDIGEGTKIWHYAHIMKAAKIGKNCVIGQNVFIGSKSEIGNNVKVQNNVSVYDGIKIEDDVFCGPSMVFTNVINPRSHLSRKDEFRSTLVRRGATLGANSTIVCGHTIGEYAFIGAGAVVTKDIPDYALAYGNPAQLKGWICSCGIKLMFNNKKTADCKQCGKKFYLQGTTVKEKTDST